MLRHDAYSRAGALTAIRFLYRLSHTPGHGRYPQQLVSTAQNFLIFLKMCAVCRAISRDPALYKDPEIFDPERFLPIFDKSLAHEFTDAPIDPMLYSFGYGRR